MVKNSVLFCLVLFVIVTLLSTVSAFNPNKQKNVVPLDLLDVVSNFNIQSDTISFEKKTHGSMNTLSSQKSVLSYENDNDARTDGVYGNVLNIYFSTFDEDFDLTLELDSVFSDQSRILFKSPRSNKVYTPRPITYSSKFLDDEGQDGYASATVLQDGSFDIVVIRGGEVFHIQPVNQHISSVSNYGHADDIEYLSASKMIQQRALSANDYNLVAYKLSSLPYEDENGSLIASCGLPTHNFRGQYTQSDYEDDEEEDDEDDMILASMKKNTDLSSLGAASRNILLKRWDKCIDGLAPNDLLDLTIAITVDYGSYAAITQGITDPELARGTVLSTVSSYVSNANLIFKSQIGINLSVGDITIMSKKTDHEWNHQGRKVEGTTCPESPQTLLQDFSFWRQETYPEKYGIVHLLTNCFPPPGVVGLAYTGAVCSDRHGSSLSNVGIPTSWAIFAHELFHVIGGRHNFVPGGGLMSYEPSGKLGPNDSHNPNQVGFAHIHTEEVCPVIRAAIEKRNKMYKGNKRVDKCFVQHSSTCGNHIVEDGEECDDGPNGSACCTPQCKFTPKSTCSGVNSCCNKCQIVPSTTSCGDGKSSGYCSRGQCVPSRCHSYSNATPCGFNPDNNCRERCQVRGKCVKLANDLLNIDSGAFCNEDGSILATLGAKQGICMPTAGESKCTPLSYEWHVEATACQDGVRPKVCRMNGLQTVSETFCAGKQLPNQPKC